MYCICHVTYWIKIILFYLFLIFIHIFIGKYPDFMNIIEFPVHFHRYFWTVLFICSRDKQSWLLFAHYFLTLPFLYISGMYTCEIMNTLYFWGANYTVYNGQSNSVQLWMFIVLYWSTEVKSVQLSQWWGHSWRLQSSISNSTVQ